MYIQLKMEYCEKSTLRDTIDQGLYEDTSRLWRLFREILDGLAYIHEKVSKYDSYDLYIISVLCLFFWGFLHTHFRAFISQFPLFPFSIISLGFIIFYHECEFYNEPLQILCISHKNLTIF